MTLRSGASTRVGMKVVDSVSMSIITEAAKSY